MPIIEVTDYTPPLFLRWRHANTIYPFLMRKEANPSYNRSRFTTHDDDFIDLDWIKKGSNHLVILGHGLEGSSRSQYITHTASLLSAGGLDILAMNYRSCSGELNRTATMYHSGFTTDLHSLIKAYEHSYEIISLVGFSLGGNMILKYLGDGVFDISKKIKSAVALSAPCDLSGSSKQIAKWFNKAYELNFLKTLINKAKAKQEQFPNKIDIAQINKINSVYKFDDYFTGPVHGFEGAEDYYSKCSSRQFLHNINVPTLLINATDDPFLSSSCYPYEEAEHNENLYFKAPKFGGHVGFTTFGQSNYWNETEIFNFISRQ